MVALRDRIRRADAVLFVTPEYNRSVPGVLKKNAIDVGSRPYGKSVWSAKPGALVSVSPAAIGNAATLLDDGGKLVAASTRDFVTKFLLAFDAWIARVLA